MLKMQAFKSLSLAAMAASIAMTLSIASADAAGRLSGHATVPNSKGGVTSVGGAATKGPNGGAAAHGHALATDGQGNAAWANGAAAKGPNGGSGATAATGHRNADGTYSGERNTTATAPNGNTYTGGYTYDQNGVVRKPSTCTDATGAVIPCPTR